MNPTLSECRDGSLLQQISSSNSNFEFSIAPLARELGLVSLYESSRDVKILCLQRFLRLFAYGISTLILVPFLEQLAVSKTRIGLFMTLTLAGDTAISFFLTLFADGLGRKAVLAAGGVLMIVSGVVFATAGSFWALLMAAIVGVISPSGSEIGPFRAIEESIVAHLTKECDRSDIYAWYSIMGLVGTALGMLSCGWVITYLTISCEWSLIASYRAVYFAYAAIGVLKLALALSLSSAVERETVAAARRPFAENDQTSDDDQDYPLLQSDTDDSSAEYFDICKKVVQRRRRRRTIFPEIDRESVSLVISLCFLFGLDSLGSGFAPVSWIAYYFQTRFDLEEGYVGTVFSVAQVLAGISMIFASSISKRIGNINAMVFTHLPASIFRAMIGFPDKPAGALALILLNASTGSMDNGPRSAFLALIIRPEQRTAVIGMVNVAKTASQSVGPLATGILVQRNLFWVCFLVSGALKGVYDLGLLVLFRNKERQCAARKNNERQQRAEDGGGGSRSRSRSRSRSSSSIDYPSSERGD